MALLLALVTVSFLVAVTVQLLADVDRQMEDAAVMTSMVRQESLMLSGLSLAQAALYGDQLENKVDSGHDSWATLGKEGIEVLSDREALLIRVEDLSGRLAINALQLKKKKELSKADQEQLEARQQALHQLWLRFLAQERFGLEGSEAAREVLDGILDWLDQDDDTREYGAEKGYYQGLEPGYESRNGPVLYREELLLVKGVTPKLFFGDGQHEGIGSYLTAGSDEDGTINLNTAPGPILQALHPELSEEMVQAMISYRQEIDHREALAEPTWYQQVSDLPGDIVLDKTLLSVVGRRFQVTVTAGEQQGRRTGVGEVSRAENGAQQILHWKVQ